jgi:diadenosine tetraphosphate (Ap4A) HIT family hydrolase
MVCEWSDAYVVSDAHPITFGHLLVISKKHTLSFGEMGTQALRGLRDNIIGLAQTLSKIRSKVVVFERGNKSENVSNIQSVDHAHFHIIPTNGVEDLLPLSKERGDFLALPDYIAQGPYYFYWNISDDVAYWGSASNVPSQFIRKIVARAEGMDSWNWRSNPSSKEVPLKQSAQIKNMLDSGHCNAHKLISPSSR